MAYSYFLEANSKLHEVVDQFQRLDDRNDKRPGFFKRRRPGSSEWGGRDHSPVQNFVILERDNDQGLKGHCSFEADAKPGPHPTRELVSGLKELSVAQDSNCSPDELKGYNFAYGRAEDSSVEHFRVSTYDYDGWSLGAGIQYDIVADHKNELLNFEIRLTGNPPRKKIKIGF